VGEIQFSRLLMRVLHQAITTAATAGCIKLPQALTAVYSPSTPHTQTTVQPACSCLLN
jgi:hypothetical protein